MEGKTTATNESRLASLEQEVLPSIDARLTKIVKTLETVKNKVSRYETLSKISKQIEYYFSEKNLPTDLFLLKHMASNAEQWVPIKVLGTFNKIKQLCGSQNKKKSKVGKNTLVGAIELSLLLEMDETKCFVRSSSTQQKNQRLSTFNLYTVLSRSVIIRKLGVTMNTTENVRKKILTKCTTKTNENSIQLVLFVSSKETPQDVLRQSYQSTNQTTNQTKNGSNALPSQPSDDQRGVDVRKERTPCVVVVLSTKEEAIAVCRMVDEPNNWRGGLRVEMMSGEKVQPTASSPSQQQHLQKVDRHSLETKRTEELLKRKKEAEIKYEQEKKIKKIEQNRKNELKYYEDTIAEAGVIGIVLHSQTREGYGFVGRDLLQQKGTYFSLNHVYDSITVPNGDLDQNQKVVSATTNDNKNDAESAGEKKKSSSVVNKVPKMSIQEQIRMNEKKRRSGGGGDDNGNTTDLQRGDYVQFVSLIIHIHIHDTYIYGT